MLWILMVICILVFLFGTIANKKARKKRNYDYDDCTAGDIIEIVSISIFIILFIVGLVVVHNYNALKAVSDEQIAIMQERNEKLCKEIEPIIRSYIKYEEDTYKNLKPISQEKIIAYAMYPQLASNKLVQKQIEIIKDNEDKITFLKLKKTELKTFKFWILMD